MGAYGASGKIMGMVSPEGPMYQAGTLSGNPLAMAAGLATVKELNARTYRRLESLTDSLVSGIRETVAEIGIAATVNSVGSMFTVFFTGERVTDYSRALGCDTEKYARFFRNLLRNGVMFPPSQFESVFVSTAHTKKQIDQTLQAIHTSLLEISQGE